MRADVPPQERVVGQVARGDDARRRSPRSRRRRRRRAGCRRADSRGRAARARWPGRSRGRARTASWRPAPAAAAGARAGRCRRGWRSRRRASRRGRAARTVGVRRSGRAAGSTIAVVARLVDVHDVAEGAVGVDAGADQRCRRRRRTRARSARERRDALAGVAHDRRGELDRAPSRCRGARSPRTRGRPRHAREDVDAGVRQRVRRGVDEDQLLLDAEREVVLRAEARPLRSRRSSPAAGVAGQEREPEAVDDERQQRGDRRAAPTSSPSR